MGLPTQSHYLPLRGTMCFSADPELVRLHAERMKEISSIREENPLPTQALTTRAVAEGLVDPLEVMAERNVDFREVSIVAPPVIPPAKRYLG